MNETEILLASLIDAVDQLDTYSVYHDDIFNEEVGQMNDLITKMQEKANVGPIYIKK